MWSARGAEDAGTAKRRRERRLRQFAMFLAETQHYAAPGGQNMSRSREEESELNNATGQKTPPPMVASTVYLSLDDDGDVLAAWPTPLVEVRPQPGVLRHTAEQIIETFVPVQVLDTPVPQLEDQVVELLQKIDAPARGGSRSWRSRRWRERERSSRFTPRTEFARIVEQTVEPQTGANPRNFLTSGTPAVCSEMHRQRRSPSVTPPSASCVVYPPSFIGRTFSWLL